MKDIVDVGVFIWYKSVLSEAVGALHFAYQAIATTTSPTMPLKVSRRPIDEPSVPLHLRRLLALWDNNHVEC